MYYTVPYSRTKLTRLEYENRTTGDLYNIRTTVEHWPQLICCRWRPRTNSRSGCYYLDLAPEVGAALCSQ